MSATTDCVSSPISILFAKNLNRSAVRRNSFSQSGVKTRLRLDPSACGPASPALSTAGLSSLATGALSSIATGFASSRSHICLTTSAPTTIRNSGTSTNKSLSCLMARTVRAPSALVASRGRSILCHLTCRDGSERLVLIRSTRKRGPPGGSGPLSLRFKTTTPSGNWGGHGAAETDNAMRPVPFHASRTEHQIISGRHHPRHHTAPLAACCSPASDRHVASRRSCSRLPASLPRLFRRGLR